MNARRKFRDLAGRIPGWLWMVLTACCFCSMGVLLRELAVNRDTDIFWLGWVRFLAGFLAMALPGLLGCWSLRIHNRKAFVWRGLLGSIGQFLLFLAIARVGLGRGTVLAYLMTVVAAVSGIWILGERLRPLVMATVVMATVGVLLACRAELPSGYEWLALGAALFSGVTLPWIRRLRRTDSNQVAFLSQGIFGTVLLGLVVWRQPMPLTPAVWALLLLMSLFDIGGQLCMTQGLSMLPVARAAALMMLTPIFSLLVGVLFLGELLSGIQYAGCGLVLVASFLAVQRRAASPAVGKTVSEGAKVK